MSKNKIEKVETTRKVRPAADVFESESGYQVVLDVVGVPQEQLEIALEAETLRVSGKREAALSEPIVYEREFALPSTVDREGVEAKCTAGVLTIHLPKVKAAQPRRIAVAAG